MDFKEKLEKSADAQTHFFNTNMRAEPVPYDERFKKGFIRGVEWLQSQPLADRLTEEEREKLTPVNRYILEQIFGKEIFENRMI